MPSSVEHEKKFYNLRARSVPSRFQYVDIKQSLVLSNNVPLSLLVNIAMGMEKQHF